MAKILGLSQPAVSMALRNHPSLPLKTRERVQNLAKELGYRPDPALSALNAYRQSKRGTKYQATLAWINAFPDQTIFHSTEKSVFQSGEFGAYFHGAHERARELGYTLEEFRVPCKEDWKRLAQTCKARRIEGILVPPRPALGEVEGQRSFPWEDFCAVAVAEAASPALHLVVNDQFQSAVLAVRQLHTLGYRKIGLIMPWDFAQETDFQFFGGYQSECRNLNVTPIAMTEKSDIGHNFVRKSINWLKAKKPDAVIAPGFDDIFPALQEAKWRVPQDIAVAFLAHSTDFPHIASIDQHGHQIGVECVNKLVDLIRRNERGVPTFPVRLLIPGRWINGSSAPPLIPA